MSESVERRLLELLDHPTTSPYGNPIPGLDELDQDVSESDLSGLTTLDRLGRDSSTRVTVVRIGEPVQNDAVLMAALRRAGALPGATVKVVGSPGGGVLVGSAGEYAELDQTAAGHVFVATG
jgi:DtxR family Mn-dependent transcriptional regulator